MIKYVLAVVLSLQSTTHAMDEYKAWVQQASAIEVLLQPVYRGQASIQIEVDSFTTVGNVRNAIASNAGIEVTTQKSLVPLITSWLFWSTEGENYIIDLDKKIKSIMNTADTDRFKLEWVEGRQVSFDPEIKIIDSKSLNQGLIASYRGKNG